MLLTENMLLAVTSPKCVFVVLVVPSRVLRLVTLPPVQWQCRVPYRCILLTTDVRPSVLETTVLLGLSSALNRLVPVLK